MKSGEQWYAEDIVILSMASVSHRVEQNVTRDFAGNIVFQIDGVFEEINKNK